MRGLNVCEIFQLQFTQHTESAGGVDGASVRAGLRAATCWSEHSTVTVIVTPLRFVTETRAWL